MVMAFDAHFRSFGKKSSGIVQCLMSGVEKRTKKRETGRRKIGKNGKNIIRLDRKHSISLPSAYYSQQ